MRFYFLTCVLVFAAYLAYAQGSNNRPPSIDKIPDYGPVLENAGPQSITLTGIGPGRESEKQEVSITASCDDEELIPEVTVQYDQGETAVLMFTPALNANGKAEITVLLDDGQSRRNTTKKSFDVTVIAINGKPSFQLSTDLISIDENAGKVEISNFAFDIEDGDPEDKQKIKFIVKVEQTSGELSFKSPPEISEKDGDLKFECNQNVFGESLISVVLEDNGGTENGGIDISEVVNFVIKVEPIDAPPTIDDIPNYGPIAENSGLQSITITGIGPGRASEKQQVSLLTYSDNETLIPEVKIQYEQAETAVLSFVPGLNANGSAKITVELSDGQSITEESFDVTVFSVNGKPSFQLSTDLISIGENPGKVEIANFAVNIDDGDPEQKQQIEFVSTVVNITGELSFQSEPVINPDNGDLVFECRQDLYGEALISVLLKDDGGIEQGGLDVSDESTFVIKVGQINAPPTIDDIPSPVTILEDEGEQLVILEGIGAGSDDENQKLSLSSISDNQELISEIAIEYIEGDASAQLKFVSAPNVFGNANITITVDDGQAINNKTSKQFFVVVNPVADTPQVTDAVLEGSTQTSSGLVINRNPIDGDEVTHFKVTNIQQGTLFFHDGISEIENNEFITYPEGNEGLKFTIANASSAPGSFDIQAATGPDDSRLGGDVITANIFVDNEAPRIISTPDSVVEIFDSYVYNLEAVDPDELDVLTFSIVIPSQIQSWLKVVKNDEDERSIFGTPPQGSAGIYAIYVKVEDQFGAYDEQTFNLNVNAQNKIPQLLPFSLEIEEDEKIFFNKEDFLSRFFDGDGGSLFSIQAANLPEFGSLQLNGNLVGTDDEIGVNDIKNLAYIPDQDYFGLDVFDWNASDGKDFATVPKRVSIFIASINDPPEIVDFEEDAFVFEYGDEGIEITKTAFIRDADGDKLSKALVAISQNYTQGEDSIYYEQAANLNFDWQDSVGVLAITGISTTSTYQEVITSLKYINTNQLAPSGGSRDIEIVLYDSDTTSIPYVREIYFEDNFVELEIPNAFTPNGDNANDRWSIANMSRYGSYEVAIYSKSGLLVFKSTSLVQEWDGTYNGKSVPVGNYYYIITINKFRRSYSGTVLVLR